MGSIVDIYDGKTLTIWKDEGWIYFSMPWVTLNIPEEDFSDFFEDLNSFVHEQLEEQDEDKFKLNGHHPEAPL